MDPSAAGSPWFALYGPGGPMAAAGGMPGPAAPLPGPGAAAQLHALMSAHLAAAASAGLPMPPVASQGVPRVVTQTHNQFAALDSDDDEAGAAAPPPAAAAAHAAPRGRGRGRGAHGGAHHAAAGAPPMPDAPPDGPGRGRGYNRGRGGPYRGRGGGRGRGAAHAAPPPPPPTADFDAPTTAVEINMALVNARMQDAGSFIRRSHALRKADEAGEALDSALQHLQVALQALGIAVGFQGTIHLPSFMSTVSQPVMRYFVRALALEGEARMRGARIRVDAEDYGVVFLVYYKPALNALNASIAVFDSAHAENVADAAAAAAPAMHRVDAQLGECLNHLLTEDARLQQALDDAQVKLEEKLFPSIRERDEVKASIGDDRWNKGFGRKSEYAMKRDEMQAKLRAIHRLVAAIVEEAALLDALRARAE